MTNTPNMKPESAPSTPATPTTGSPQQDAQKTNPGQPHVEPKPAPKI
ncbi:MAG TPA: hypothetical protein VLV55_07295 [Rhizomicrobium sp.]|nr:hypothetical protein [Rhizomicrobium sp.]